MLQCFFVTSVAYLGFVKGGVRHVFVFLCMRRLWVGVALSGSYVVTQAQFGSHPRHMHSEGYSTWPIGLSFRPSVHLSFQSVC